MRILVVDDDHLLLEHVSRLLISQGYQVEVAEDGESGYEKAKKGIHSAIILDINMPSMNGSEVCRQLRSANYMVPILFLSANSNDRDKINGLDIGADDYLVKPFSSQELLARIRALTRRPERLLSRKLEYTNIKIHIDENRVWRFSHEISLTPKEFQLLQTLMSYPNKSVKREYLLRKIWGVSVGNTSNRLEACIRSLRAKLDKPYGTQSIETVYGVGYKFNQH